MSTPSRIADCTIKNHEESRDTRTALCHAHMRQSDEVIRRTPPWLGPSAFVSLERRGSHRCRNLALSHLAFFLHSRGYISGIVGGVSAPVFATTSDSRWLVCSRVSPEVVSNGQRRDHNSEVAISHLLSSLPLLPPQILDAFSGFLYGREVGRSRRICVPGWESKLGFNLVLEHYKDPKSRILTWTQPQRSSLSLCDRHSDTWLPRQQDNLQSFLCPPNPLVRIYHMNSNLLAGRSSRLRSANTSRSYDSQNAGVLTYDRTNLPESHHEDRKRKRSAYDSDAHDSDEDGEFEPVSEDEENEYHQRKLSTLSTSNTKNNTPVKQNTLEDLASKEEKENIKQAPKRVKRGVKIPIACAPCRSRKGRCDGDAPCTMCRRRGTEALCTYDTVIRRRGPGKKTTRGDTGKNRRAPPITRTPLVRRDLLTPSNSTPNIPSPSLPPIAPAPFRAPSVKSHHNDIPSSEGSDYKELVRREVGLDIIPAQEDQKTSVISNISDSTMAILTSVSEDDLRVPPEEPLAEQNATFPPSDKSTCLCSDDLEFLSTIPPTTGNVTPEERRWHDFSDDCVLPEAPKSEGVTCELSLPSTFLNELLSNNSAGWDYFGDITNLYERSRPDLEGITPTMILDEDDIIVRSTMEG